MRQSDGRVRKTRVRHNESSHAHELTISCNHGIPLLSKDRSRQWLSEALDLARKRWSFELWAYVIMPEHAHVLIWPRLAEYDICNPIPARIPIAAT